MRRPPLAILALPLALAASALVAAPAQAAEQPLFGTTVDVTILPSGDSLLGGTAYAISSGGGVLVNLGTSLAADVDFELYDGATLIASCTVLTGSTSCGDSVSALSAGPHAVTARFTQSSVTVDFTGTIFTVQNVAPTVRVEWQDASGAWIDGSSTGLPFFGDIVARCAVTNNSNAPLTFSSFLGSVTHTGGPTVTAITGDLAAGTTGYYPIWSGNVSLSPAASCSGSVAFPDGTTSGNGNGGGVIPVTGTIEASPAPAPGRTVAIAAANLVPPVATSYFVTLDGVEVAGPFTTSAPDFDFHAEVVVPSTLSPGVHSVAVYAQYSERSIAFAYFTFEIPAPALAATGVDATARVVAGSVILALGALLLLAARRRRPV